MTDSKGVSALQPSARRRAPIKPYGRLCHGYCVLQFMPLRQTQTPRDCRQAFLVSGLVATRGGTPLRRGWAHGGRGGDAGACYPPSLFQQHLGLLEVRCLEACGYQLEIEVRGG